MFHPDDPLFQRFRVRMETGQGKLARPPQAGRRQAPLSFWAATFTSETVSVHLGIVVPTCRSL